MRHLSRLCQFTIASYAILLAALTLCRVLRLGGISPLDLANVFAPWLYLPLLLTLPLSLAYAWRRSSGKSKRDGRSPLGWLRAGWLALLQIALLIYACCAFGWLMLPKPTLPPPDDTISVITFNVQGSNARLDRAVDWLLAADADIVALQETRDGYDSRLAQLVAAYPHEAHIENGVRVFSRLPILSREVLILEESPGWLALKLLLVHDGRELALYAAHLALPRAHDAVKAGFGWEMARAYDESRRNAQIRRLLQLLRGETAPVIVAGDFNMSDSSLIYDAIALQLDDAWREVGHGAGRTWPLAHAIGWHSAIPPLLRIDYLWHSEHLRAATAELGADVGSDHLPLHAAFAWR